MEAHPNPLVTPFGLQRERESIRRALFFDRDGCIVADKKYIRSPDQLELLPGAARLLAALQESWRLIVITNQSGVARGYFSEGELQAIHERLIDLLSAEGGGLDAIYYCPHHPYAGSGEYTKACNCRKPGVGMIREAAARFRLDLGQAVVIGDSWRDIECGQAAGAKTLFLGDPGSLPSSEIIPDHAVPTLLEALPLLQG